MVSRVKGKDKTGWKIVWIHHRGQEFTTEDTELTEDIDNF